VNSETLREGGCQCGHVRYRLNGPPLTLYACHCRDCQKQSASAFGMSLWVRRDDFEIVSGELSFWTTRGDSGAAKICAFCRHCGTRIHHAADDDRTPFSVKAGTLDETSGLQPVAHIWTKRAQPWALIDRERQPCFAEEPEDEELMRLWQAHHGSA
jgi:hypothetical protein